ncbi:hypothetical protein Scep_000636 [Stephania cephalantha]|uniref:Uncharacterized protein n=1 Tax=Stephania cephalantha TaxID=152367 RepID=A0AAP0Q340_9MAGN
MIICMEGMDLKKFVLLFLVVSASFLSTSLAVRRGRFVNKVAEESEINNETSNEFPHHDDEAGEIHERLLKVNTKDYGRYDPAPALVKPPFKLIPN